MTRVEGVQRNYKKSEDHERIYAPSVGTILHQNSIFPERVTDPGNKLVANPTLLL